MTVLNFPKNPTVGQEYTLNGVVYTWDSQKWTASEGGSTVSVEVGDSAPLNPSDGDLWWDSSKESGRLYVFYTDSNSAQWVECSPAGGIDDPLWDHDNGVLSPYNAGDSVQIGGGDITLNPDGNATFTGDVETNGYLWANGPESYLVVNRTGAATLPVAEFGGTTTTSRITADGSAEFNGNVQSVSSSIISPLTTAGISYFSCNDEVGGYSTKIQFNSGGSATFAGEVSSDNAFVSDRYSGGFWCFRGTLNGTQTSLISADGSAQFAGTVSSTGNVSGGTSTSTYGIIGQSGSSVGDSAAIFGRQYSVGGLCWRGVDSSATTTSKIFADGSATFNGNVNTKTFINCNTFSKKIASSNFLNYTSFFNQDITS